MSVRLRAKERQICFERAHPGSLVGDPGPACSYCRCRAHPDPSETRDLLSCFAAGTAVFVLGIWLPAAGPQALSSTLVRLHPDINSLGLLQQQTLSRCLCIDDACGTHFSLLLG